MNSVVDKLFGKNYKPLKHTRNKKDFLCDRKRHTAPGTFLSWFWPREGVLARGYPCSGPGACIRSWSWLGEGYRVLGPDWGRYPHPLARPGTELWTGPVTELGYPLGKDLGSEARDTHFPQKRTWDQRPGIPLGKGPGPGQRYPLNL